MAVPHTPSTYHRTWETGLGVEIRVATVSPDFFVSGMHYLVPSLPRRQNPSPTNLPPPVKLAWNPKPLENWIAMKKTLMVLLVLAVSVFAFGGDKDTKDT